LSAGCQRILYLSYDGMLEPLGQSQVLAYLEKLAPGREIHLLSFEKPKDWADAEVRSLVVARIAEAGITWHPRLWRNRPRILAAVYNLLVGLMVALSIAIRHRISLFHARNILCSAMTLPAVFIRRGTLISDIRGFWPDERVDGGLIAADGIVYRVLKAIERAALRRSSAIVTLTHASVPILKDDPRFGHPRAPVSVIPTCVDLRRFKPPLGGTRPRGEFIFGYVGSFGTWYMLDETIALFAVVLKRRSDAKLLIANRNEHDSIRQALESHGVPRESCELCAVRYAEMPQIIQRMSVGACFVRPQFSKVSSAPTKFAEYLACGVPVVAVAGVGDLADIIGADRVGLAVSEPLLPQLSAIAEKLLALADDPTIAERCRAVAEARFSLDVGVAAYREIYEGLRAVGK